MCFNCYEKKLFGGKRTAKLRVAKRDIKCYKVMLGFNKAQPGLPLNYRLKTPFKHFWIQLGETPPATMSTKKFKKFIADSVSYKRGIYPAAALFSIKDGGYHSFPSINDSYDTFSYFHRKWKNGDSEPPVIVRCEIPAWSGIIRGLDDDTMNSIASNRIKLLEIVPAPESFKIRIGIRNRN